MKIAYAVCFLIFNTILFAVRSQWLSFHLELLNCYNNFTVTLHIYVDDIPVSNKSYNNTGTKYNISLPYVVNQVVHFTWTSESNYPACYWSVSNVIISNNSYSLQIQIPYICPMIEYYSCNRIMWFHSNGAGSVLALKTSKYKLPLNELSKIDGCSFENITINANCDFLFPSIQFSTCLAFTSDVFLPSTCEFEYFTSIQTPLSIQTSLSLYASLQESTYKPSLTIQLPASTTPSSTTLLSSISSYSTINYPSPTLLYCPGDGSIWFDTRGDSNATGTCYRGTVNATRYCRENGVWDDVTCHTSPVFDAILSQIDISPEGSLELLTSDDLSSSQVALLFNAIVSSNMLLQNVSQEFIQSALEFTNYTIYSGKIQTENEELKNSIGTQLLLTLDTLALNSLQTNLSLSIDNIALRVQEVVFPLAGDKIVGINVESNSIQLPSDISFTMNDTIKIASFVFHNLSQLLSPQTNERRLISPVISATCINCKKTDLNPQVNISFNLSSQEISPNDNLICVFLDISESNDSLPTSDWSTEGCSYQEENSIITCQCDHLTHFAILLSPRAPDGGVHDEILTVVGYVLTPISLVCMLLVIFTYACLKSLWNMRSYIHIMLCINLFIAQLLFVVGIERTEYLPVCSVIAVILQYMYLVSFMWMLMEGVVLYVALIRVFIKHPKRYIAAFTISSYGIPALYMMIVIPIGFLAGGDHTYYLYYNSNITDRQTNYSTMINGNNNDVVACWLDYESGFVFTFIVPVIAIILANCGFFIMSIVIMWKHNKKQTYENKAINFGYWLKVSISLTVVMGIGWIFNILFFARELLFVAYIMTVFVAGQGIVIFILYVPCSKNVRKAYYKWYFKISASSSVSPSGGPSTKTTRVTVVVSERSTTV